MFITPEGSDVLFLCLEMTTTTSKHPKQKHHASLKEHKHQKSIKERSPISRPHSVQETENVDVGKTSVEIDKVIEQKKSAL